MITEREELLSLTRQAERMRQGCEPWKASAIEEQAEEIRERLTYFEDLHQEILDMSSDRVTAGVLWAEIYRQGGDVMQQVSKLASTLFAKGLLTPEQFQGVVSKLRFIPNVTRKAREQAEEEERRMKDAVQMVIQAAEPANRDYVRYEYNKLEGFRTWEKLNTWVKNCIDAGLLPKTYLAGVRGGNLLEKMLHPSQNKELKAGENK